MDRIKAILFAKTGFGNNAFKVMQRHSLIEIVGVFTNRREEKPFPYYECEKLHDAVTKANIQLYEGLNFKKKEAQDTIKRLSPELIVVGSFDQIIPDDIISIPRFGVINMHPSLLPKYRGATPTVWALLNGEEETGVTVHFIENGKVDSGRIIVQARLRIHPSDNDGILRHRLAVLSEEVLLDAINTVLTTDKRGFAVQNEAEATYYPKRSLNDAEIDLGKTFKEVVNRIRAMTPHPGAFIRYNNRNYIVKSAELIKNKNLLDIPRDEKRHLILNTPEGPVKFYTL
ncbi:MAG: formyltransferase family protein [Nitrospirota bacterium]